MIEVPHLSPHDIQDIIIQEFQSLEGDREAMLQYIMELGEKLPIFPDAYKIKENEIKGCMSKVWLTFQQKDGRLYFEADSNTAITKGLISLLIRIFSGQPIFSILHTDLYVIDKIGMHQLIGSQRSSGLANMIKHIKLLAAMHSSIKSTPHDQGSRNI